MAQTNYIWQLPGWPKLHLREPAVASAVALARQDQGKVIGMVRAIGVPGMEPVIRDIWVDEAVATAAIEGEALELQSVRSSVMRRIGMEGDLGAPASRSVDGLLDLMQDATTSYQEVLDDDRLCRWQSALFPGGASGIRQITVGRYRDSRDPMQIVSGPIGREKVHFEAPDSAFVPAQMRQFLKWFAMTKPKAGKKPHMDGIVRAAIAHLWFETIHPFDDGNGRVGRAIVDRALAQDTASSLRLYSMDAQLMRERATYYHQLGAAQRGTLDVTAWVAWFVEQFRLACVTSQQVVATAIERSRFWATHATHDINARQRKVLARMLDAGIGGFTGGMSAEKYRNFTGASKATATRDLVELENAGLLVASGQGRATRYWVNVPGWRIGDGDAK